MNKLMIFAFLIGLFSCKNQHQTNTQSSPTLYNTPITIANSFQLNALQKKPLQPSKHQIIKKSVPLDIREIFFEKQELSTTDVFTSETALLPNVKKATPPTTYRVSSSAAVKDTNFVLVNSANDTLPTGVAIAIKGIKKWLKAPEATQAKPPELRTKTNFDIQTFAPPFNLPSSRIFDVCLSKENALWLATYNGISYYDGNSFLHYTTKEGLPTNNAQEILEDSKGNVWFSLLEQGLCKYDGDSLTVFGQESGLDTRLINPLIEDKAGNMWWGTHQGVVRFDGKQATHYTVNEGLPHNTIFSLYADSRGDVWIGTRRGLCKFDGTKIINYALEGMPVLSIASITEDHQKNIWFGTVNRGLFKKEGQNCINYTQKQGLQGRFIKAIGTDTQGNIIIGSVDNGLAIFDGTNFTHYTTKEGFPCNVVMNLVIDASNSIWVATYECGLVKCSFNSFVYPVTNFFNNNAVKAFDTDSKNNLWMIANRQGTLIKQTGGQLTFYNKLLYKYKPQTLLVDKQDNIWIGGLDGLKVYNQGVLHQYLRDMSVLTLIEDTQGNIWIGTERKGLLKYDGKKMYQYTRKESLKCENVCTILEDYQGYIWLGSSNGLYKLEDKQLINYTKTQGETDRVNTLFEDSQHNLWIGSDTQGLLKYDGKKTITYTTQEGLASNNVASIIEDHQKNIWVGTSKGLSQLIGTTRGQKKIINYTVNCGLKGIDFEPNSVLLDHQNRLWWGTNKALTYLDLNQQKLVKQTPEVHLQEVFINEQRLSCDQVADSLQGMIQYKSQAAFNHYPIGLSVPYYLNHFTFYFSSAQSITSRKTYYTYRIKELDKAWSKPTTKAWVDYRNLPYGTFTLLAKAMNEQQEWGKVFKYTFTVCCPWWYSWWFKTLIVCTVIALLWNYHHWRVMMITKRQVVLESLIDERTAELKNAYEALDKAKEKEQKILLKAVKNRERRFLIAIQLFDEKQQELTRLENKLNQLMSKHKIPELALVKKEFNKLVQSIASIDILSDSVESKYPKMLAEITSQFPCLSINEVKHCVLIKLNCSSKEAAQLLGVSTNAVHMARKRLKKKFQLSETESLQSFLQTTLL